MVAFLTPESAQFREEVRVFLAAKLPAAMATATRAGLHLPREMIAAWHGILHARGWSAPHWPAEFGGAGWSAAQRYIFEEECARADAPPLSVFGLNLVGPTIYTFGSPEQKARFLPPILSGEHFWCQGYSEPQAGSDLAALRTVARRDGDGWVINGQKAWTTEAHHADYMICLARTDQDVKPQAGLSLFLVNMRAKGVSVTPVLTLDEGHSVNTTFLDDVHVDDDALLGEPNQGWSYAKFLLSHERTNNAQVYRSRREFERLLDLAALTPGPDGPAWLDDSGTAHLLAEIEMELSALEASVFRVLADEVEGRAPGPEASILKLEGSRLQQRVTDTALRILGEEGACLDHVPGGSLAATDAGGWIERHLFRRAVTIYAGASEVQKNIIAKTVLGLQ